jgi:hypothetical protein
MTFAFNQENTTSRRRLVSIVNSLTTNDYSLTTPAGWTVSALLAHLAFLDQRVLVLLRRWKKEGVDESPLDSEAMNDASKPILLALDPKEAVAICLASAEAVDAELEAITPELVESIQASPNFFRFNRGLHRNDHLNEIERLLQAAHPERDK